MPSDIESSDFFSEKQSRRNRLCGYCHYEFHGKQAKGMTWCKTDRMFVCEKCQESICSKGHKTGFYIEKIVSVVIIFAFMVIPLGIMAIADVSAPVYWNSIPVSEISSASSGKTIKVQGTIESDYLAWGSHEHRAKSGRYWEWNHSVKLTIMDSTGSITVDCDGYFIKPAAPHTMQLEHITGGAFHNGDRIVVVGNVESGSTGLVLVARTINQPGEASPVDPLAVFGIFIIFIPFALGAIKLRNVRKERDRLHNEKTKDAQPTSLPKERIVKNPELPWKNNRLSMGLRGRTALACAAIVIGVLLCIGLWLFMPPHERGDYYFTVMITGWIVMFLVYMPIAWVPESERRPAEIAVDATGIHFWYDKPDVRMLFDDFVPWTDVDDIKYVKTGKTGYWALKEKNGMEVYLSDINKPIFDEILNEWKRRKEQVQVKQILMT